MRILSNKRGMTAVEVIVAMSILALVGMGLLTMLVQSLRGWGNGTSNEAANSTATTAMQRLSYDIREARSATTNGSQLTVTFPLALADPVTHETAYDSSLNDPVTRSYYVSNGNLVRNIGGTITTLRRGVSSVSFVTTADSAEITVTATQQMGTSVCSQQATGRVTFRNYH